MIAHISNKRLITLICFVLVSLACILIGFSQVRRRGPAVSWQQSKATSVTLGVRDKFGSLGAYTADFIVTGPDRKKYSVNKQVNSSDWGYVSFPGDFTPSFASVGGVYSVECLVNSRVVTRDRFRYTSPGDFLQ
jgi:hypothetical protein